MSFPLIPEMEDRLDLLSLFFASTGVSDASVPALRDMYVRAHVSVGACTYAHIWKQEDTQRSLCHSLPYLLETRSFAASKTWLVTSKLQ